MQPTFQVSEPQHGLSCSLLWNVGPSGGTNGFRSKTLSSKEKKVKGDNPRNWFGDLELRHVIGHRKLSRHPHHPRSN